MVLVAQLVEPSCLESRELSHLGQPFLFDKEGVLDVVELCAFRFVASIEMLACTWHASSYITHDSLS